MLLDAPARGGGARPARRGLEERGVPEGGGHVGAERRQGRRLRGQGPRGHGQGRGRRASSASARTSAARRSARATRPSTRCRATTTRRPRATTSPRPTRRRRPAPAMAYSMLGVNKAARKWAQKVGVDPYTTNPILKKALTDIGQIDAAGGIAAKVVVPIPMVVSGTATRRQPRLGQGPRGAAQDQRAEAQGRSASAPTSSSSST